MTKARWKDMEAVVTDRVSDDMLAMAAAEL
jgi:hypothetical protein